jgi:hypothetical protein
MKDIGFPAQRFLYPHEGMVARVDRRRAAFMFYRPGNLARAVFLRS